MGSLVNGPVGRNDYLILVRIEVRSEEIWKIGEPFFGDADEEAGGPCEDTEGVHWFAEVQITSFVEWSGN